MTVIFFPVKSPSIMLTGGRGTKDESSIEILTSDSRTKLQLPNLPYQDTNHSIFNHNGTLMVCGGTDKNAKKCYQLLNGFWTKFSNLKGRRCGAHVVKTTEATFLFGGNQDPKTFEYLPKNGKGWKLGKTKIPEGFCFGSAVEVKSYQEIWLIGGEENTRRILVFNLKTHAFGELESTLKTRRELHACISTTLDGNEVILVTGGRFSKQIVEIINTFDGSVTVLANQLVSRRFGHGIGILRIENQDKIVVFGGTDGTLDGDHSSVEIFDNETKEWKLDENIKLSEARWVLGFCADPCRPRTCADHLFSIYL